MAIDSIEAPVGQQQVMTVLADPPRYSYFVIGNARVRGYDAHWPKERSAFRHALGVGALVLHDSTTSLATDEIAYLALLTGVGILGTNITVFWLEPRLNGTLIWLYEEPIIGPLAWLWNRTLDRVLSRRNRWTLTRLRRLAIDTAHSGPRRSQTEAAADRWRRGAAPSGI